MVEIDIPVYCANCGRGICGFVEVRNSEFHITPCEYCVEDFQREAVEEYKSKHGLD